MPSPAVSQATIRFSSLVALAQRDVARPIERHDLSNWRKRFPHLLPSGSGNASARYNLMDVARVMTFVWLRETGLELEAAGLALEKIAHHLAAAHKTVVPAIEAANLIRAGMQDSEAAEQAANRLSSAAKLASPAVIVRSFAETATRGAGIDAVDVKAFPSIPAAYAAMSKEEELYRPFIVVPLGTIMQMAYLRLRAHLEKGAGDE